MAGFEETRQFSVGYSTIVPGDGVDKSNKILVVSDGLFTFVPGKTDGLLFFNGFLHLLDQVGTALESLFHRGN